MIVPFIAVSLLSPWMLAWAATGLIPLALYLWNRRQPRRIQWPAVRVLERVLQQQSQRIKLQQWLLLLLRCSIPVLLAAILARPTLDYSDSSLQEEGANRNFWIIAVDNSYSMQLVDSRGESTLEKAKRMARQLVADAGPTDCFSVIAFEGPYRNLISTPTMDHEAVLATIEDIATQYTPPDISGAFAAIGEAVTYAGTENIPDPARIVVYTDMGSDMWESAPVDQPAWQDFASQHLLRIVPFSPASLSNAAIVDMGTKERALRLGSVSTVSVKVAQFGNSETPRKLTLLADDQIVESRRLEIAPNEEKTFDFSVTWQKPGPQLLTAQLDSDNLSVDDTRRLWVDVEESTRVIIAEAVPDHSVPMQVALEALRDAGQATDGLETKVVSATELVDERLNPSDVVILDDLPTMPPPLWQRLESNVMQGLGLAVLHGEQTIASNWNSALASTQRIGNYRLEARSEFGLYRIDPLQYQSPLTLPFEAFPDSGLLTTPIFQYWRTDQVSPAAVDLAFTDGQPWIFSAALGRGRMLVVTSGPGSLRDRARQADNAPREPMNALATWPSFLPLVQQIVLRLSSYDGNRSLVVGMPIVDSLADRSQDQIDSSVTISRPDGSKDTLDVFSGVLPNQAATTTQWTYPNTDLPGIYRAQIGVDQTSYVVNIEPLESSLLSIDPTRIPQSSPARWQTESTASEQPNQAKARLWQWLLGGLLAMLMAESTLAWWMGRRG